MYSTELKPQVFEHGKPGKCNKKMYVVEFFLSSHLIERHTFLNKRIYERYINYLYNLFPLNISRYYSGISFDYYELFYTPEDYRSLLDDDNN